MLKWWEFLCFLLKQVRVPKKPWDKIYSIQKKKKKKEIMISLDNEENIKSLKLMA